MKLGGFDVLIRKAVENGKPIFKEAFVLTEKERVEAVEQGLKVESLERLKQTTKGKFYGQYLNDPMDDSLIEFKRTWIQPINIPVGHPLQNEMKVSPALISIDPAVSLSKTSDYTGICVTKTLSDNNVYVLEAKGIKANPAMLVEEVFRLVETYAPVEKVLFEMQASQVTFLQLFQEEMKKRNKFFVLHEVRPESNEMKTARIRSLIPHYANRRIFHAPGLFQLEEQLVEFPKGQHDDVIDALSYQVKFWHRFKEEHKAGDIPEGSYAWWRNRSGNKNSNVIGKLFNDFRGR